MTPEILQHWYRVAFCAWACLSIGLLVAREAVRETGWRRTMAAWLARANVLMAMLILTRFGDHTVREYVALAEVVSKSESGKGATHSISDIQIAQVTHVDRYESPNGWAAEFETYDSGRRHWGAGDSRQMPVAGGRSGGSWGTGLNGDGDPEAATGNSARVPNGKRGVEFRISGERF
jgi:hypothetical protein